MIGGLGTLLIFIIILGVIVLVHEFGHFFFAKKFGVYVHEFSIGMGPKLWGKKKGETDYSIRAIPIGGYCALAGEDGYIPYPDTPSQRIGYADCPRQSQRLGGFSGEGGSLSLGSV